jgi:hypothetical protein
MKKISLALLIASALTSPVYAGEVSITWQTPEKYTDIRPSSETREAFQERVAKELGEVFVDLAKKLPDDVKWAITVTDVDLAGDVHPMMRGTANDIRIIKEIYWPRMSLSYRMTDGKGATIAEGQEDIKDMNFMMGMHIPSGHTSFEYEEKCCRTGSENSSGIRNFRRSDH